MDKVNHPIFHPGNPASASASHNPRRIFTWLIAAFLLSTSLWSCSGSTNTESGVTDSVYRPKETATRGEITIGADLVIKPLAEQWIDAFHHLYKDSKINVRYLNEPELFQQLADDSLRLILATRPLRETEERYYKSIQARVKPKELAENAHVVILNPENGLDSIRSADIGKVVRGEISDWTDLGRTEEGPVELVFDHPQSAIVRYINDRYIEDGDSIDARLYAAESHEELIEFVSTRPNALGFIGGAWVSDRDNPETDSILAKVKLAHMQTPDTSDLPGTFVLPYQNDIALHRYPFTYEVFALNRESKSGLGTGFVVFAAGEQGQRIVLKSGLYPAFPPPRLVVFPELDK